jgi:peptidase E
MKVLTSLYNFHEKWAFNELSKFIYPTMNVVALPLSFEDDEVANQEAWEDFYGENSEEYEDILKPFKAYGINKVSMINYFTDTKEEMKKMIEDADILLLTGGSSDEYMKRIVELELKESILSKEFIIATSAGAYILLNDFVISYDEDSDQIGYYSGLNIIENIRVIAHYEACEFYDRIISELSEKHDTYALSDKGCVLINDGKISVLGNVTVFKRGN